MKKLLSTLLAVIFVISCLPMAISASVSGVTPDASNYDGIVLSRVFATGDKKDASCKYSFVELYNTAENDMTLSGLSLYYRTAGAESYVEYELPDDVIPSGGYYLIRCKAAKKYEDANAVVALNSWDAEWDITFDSTKELGLVLAPHGMEFSVSEHLDALDGTVSYFCMSEEGYFDSGYVDDLGKSKFAVRTELRKDSGWYLLNLTKANSDKLAQVLPQSSDGVAAEIVQCAISEVTFSKPAGFYEEGFDLSLGAPDGYDIYYTLDGSDPLTSSTALLYSNALTLTDTGSKGCGAFTQYVASILGNSYLPADNDLPGGWVVKAYATDGVETTAVFTSSYFISPAFAGYNTNVVSISIEKGDFVGPEGFYNNFYVYSYESNPKQVATVEVFDEQGTRRGYSNVDISISGHGSAYDFDMKSMKINFKKAYNQEGGRETKLNYDPFDGTALNCKGQAITTYDRLVLRTSSHDQWYAMMRDIYHHNMATGDNIDTQAGTPALVFINGEFWGFYNIRERYCAEYFANHYGVDEDNVAFLENDSVANYQGIPMADYVISDGPEGCAQDFNDLARFARTHDLTIASNYDYVCSKLDIHSLMDIFITRLYFSNLDWMVNNVKVWRNLAGAEDPSGMDDKWRFVMVDCDFGSGVGPNGQDASVTSNYYSSYMDMPTCILGGFMSSLLKNPNFRNEYLIRSYRAIYEDFDYDTKALPTIMRLMAERKDLMPLNVKRWHVNTMENYYDSIDTLCDFAQRRYGYAMQYLCNYFNITETKLRAMAGYDYPDLYGASCDFLYINDVAQNPVCGAPEWMAQNLADRVIDGTNGQVRTIGYKGWLGFTQGVEGFGYRINDEEPVFSSAFTVSAENAAKLPENGGPNAIRYKITVPVYGLSGENDIAFLVKVGGKIYEMDGSSFTAINTLRPYSDHGITYYCDPEVAEVGRISSRDTVSIDGTRIGSFGHNPEISEFSLIGQAGKTITLYGWHANQEGIAAFGYRVDGGEAVYSDDFFADTEQKVYDAAEEELNRCTVSRFLIGFPTLPGEHEVEIFCDTGTREITIWTIRYDTGAAPDEPDIPDEPDVPDEPTATYHGGCFDSLFINGALAPLMNGKAGHGSERLDAVNRTVDGTNGSILELAFRGWIGFEEPIEALGYQIDDNAPVYGDFAIETEAAVNAPENGGPLAKRYYVTVPVSELTGTHTVCVVAKVSGIVVKLDGDLPKTATQPAPNTSLTYLAPEPEVCEHVWGEWVVTTEPTCTENGEETRSCGKCSETETREVAAVGHNFGEWAVTADPTCTENGEETRSCGKCSETETREVAALGHDFGEWYVATEATVTTEGLNRRDCSRCDAYETEVIPVIEAREHEIYADAEAYGIGITDAATLDTVRIAPGVYASGSEMKNSDELVTLNARAIAGLTNADGDLRYEIPYGGEWTVWYNDTDSSQKLQVLSFNTDLDVIVNGSIVTIKNLNDIRDIFVANGHYTVYRDVKNNLAFQLNGMYLDGAKYYSYPNGLATGEYTLYVRHNDGTYEILYFETECVVPELTAGNGRVVIRNLEGVKAIRIAPGTYTNTAEIKAAEGYKCYDASMIKNRLVDDSVTLPLAAGTYTICVNYYNNFKHITVLNITK